MINKSNKFKNSCQQNVKSYLNIKRFIVETKKVKSKYVIFEKREKKKEKKNGFEAMVEKINKLSLILVIIIFQN